MFKSNKIQSKLQTQTILADEHQGSYIFRQMFWLPASSSVLNCFSILLLFTFIAQCFKIKAGIIVFFLLPWCLYLSFSGDFSYSLHIQSPVQETSETAFHTVRCKPAERWACVLKHFPELQAMVFSINCLVLSNGMGVAQLSVPGTLLAWTVWEVEHRLTFPWRFSVPWFFPEVVGGQGMIYVLHRVHLYCRVHHSAETP